MSDQPKVLDGTVYCPMKVSTHTRLIRLFDAFNADAVKRIGLQDFLDLLLADVELRQFIAARRATPTHHPGTEPRGHVVTECEARGCNG